MESLMKNRHLFIYLLILMSFLMSCSRPSGNLPIANPTSNPPAVPTALPAIVPTLHDAPSTPSAGINNPPSNARPLTLSPLGAVRSLPDKILGASVESLIEHVLDDPLKVAAIKTTAPGVIRFPGGSQSNYYDWQDGQIHFNVQSNSSSYYKYWAGIAPLIARGHPNGVSYEDYVTFANQIGGADPIIVPNLETSTVASQSAWFTKLGQENLAPRNIELGNEFWVAMAGDPNVMRKWPDEPSSMSVMQQYADQVPNLLSRLAPPLLTRPPMINVHFTAGCYSGMRPWLRPIGFKQSPSIFILIHKKSSATRTILAYSSSSS
jgi:hypothetical protein